MNEIPWNPRMRKYGPFKEVVARERAKWKSALIQHEEDSKIQNKYDVEYDADEHYGFAPPPTDDTLETELAAILDEELQDKPRVTGVDRQEIVRDNTSGWSRVQQAFMVNQWPTRVKRAYEVLTSSKAHQRKRECVRDALLYEDTWVPFFLAWLFLLIVICLIRYV